MFVRMEGQPTTRDETRERSPTGRTNPWSPVSSSGVNLRVLNDVGGRRTVQTEGQTAQEEFSGPVNPGISFHRGPRTVPVEQPQQAVPPGLGGSEGGGQPILVSTHDILLYGTMAATNRDDERSTRPTRRRISRKPKVKC